MAIEDRERNPAASSGGLDERVLSTLQGLQGRIAFSGLRRALRAHPESLSRALRRLEREGLIERGAGGYRALVAPGRDRSLSTELRTVATIDLPPGVPAEVVRGRLSGRWFGSLRWVGLVDRPGDGLLSWSGRDGAGFVLLGIDHGVLRVLVPRDFEGDDPAESEDAAYELLAHAVEALRFSGAPPPRAAAQLSAAPGLDPAWGLEN